MGYLFESCRKMVTETRSMMGGRNSSRGRGRGRGRNTSPHVSSHESHVQEENREEAQGEHHADFEEVSLRQLMRSILECLPLPKDIDQGKSHHSRNEVRQRSRSPHRDPHGDK